MMRRRLIAVAIATGVLAVAGVSTAAEDAQFQIAEAGSALFPNQAYVITLDNQKLLTSGDVTVTEDGESIDGAAVQSAASAQGIGTVLLIDASNSMRGSIDDAMKAARAFAARNPGQPLSVVTFNSRPTVALPFTTNQAEIKATLTKTPALAEGTRIYDALSAAVAQIRDSRLGAGRVVLLSDGDDVGSETSKSSAISQLEDEKIRVYTVGIKSPDFTSGDLEDIASSTGGSYAEAGSSGALLGIYDALGYKLANEYLLVYRSPASPGEKVDVDITVKGAGTQSVAYTTPETGTGAPYEKPLKDRVLQSWVLTFLLAGSIVLLLVYAVQKVLQIRTNRRLRARLGDFVTLPEEEAARARREEVSAMLGPTTTSRSSIWAERRWFREFAEDVELAGIVTEPQRLLLWSGIAGVVIAVFAGVLIGPFWALLGVLPPLLAKWEVGRRADRLRKEFGEQLPDNLAVMASALRAGHSLVGSMNVVVEQAAEPSKSEFRRVVTDEQLGIPLDEALEVTAKRMKNLDLDQVAIVAMLQREAGGNMAEVLDQVIVNIRARMELRRLVRVLTAQGRLARWIITGIPIFLLLFLQSVNPDHLQPLFHETLGQVALIVAAVMVVAGSLVIKKLVDIEL